MRRLSSLAFSLRSFPPLDGSQHRSLLSLLSRTRACPVRVALGGVFHTLAPPVCRPRVPDALSHSLDALNTPKRNDFTRCSSLSTHPLCPGHALLYLGVYSLDSVTSHSFGAGRRPNPSTFARVSLLVPTPCVSLPHVCLTLCCVLLCLFSKVDASPNLVITRPVAKEGKEEAFMKSTEPRGCNDIYHGSILVDWTDEDSPVSTQ